MARCKGNNDSKAETEHDNGLLHIVQDESYLLNQVKRLKAEIRDLKTQLLQERMRSR